MEMFTIAESIEEVNETIDNIVSENEGAVIKVVGVGGAGGNMINHMIRSGTAEVEFYAANTDIKDLSGSLAPHKVQMGVKLTKGLGAGMRPEKGKESAIENYDEIRGAMNGADIVFIAAGLGGGTGTGAAPIIAQAAKEVGALTIAVVTMPFKFEGRKRSKLADAGLLELKKRE